MDHPMAPIDTMVMSHHTMIIMDHHTMTMDGLSHPPCNDAILYHAMMMHHHTMMHHHHK